jgi:hypothetical protein
MGAMARRIQDREELRAYFEVRVQKMSERILDAFDDLFSKEATQRHREFEDHVERRLRNGAKFVPRTRQPR